MQVQLGHGKLLVPQLPALAAGSILRRPIHQLMAITILLSRVDLVQTFLLILYKSRKNPTPRLTQTGLWDWGIHGRAQHTRATAAGQQLYFLTRLLET